MATWKKSNRLGIARSLHEDLISEILLRVPIKDILKFKSVCKSWLSLITNPIFANEVLARSHQEAEYGEEIILKTVNKQSGDGINKCESNYFCINSQQNTRHIIVRELLFSSKQGLINQNDLSLLSSSNYLFLFQNIDRPNQLYIYSYITSHFVLLPPAQYDRVSWALVYDPRIHKYKVYGICILGKFLTFTQGESEWKEVDIPTESSAQLHTLTELIFVNKELHWLVVNDYTYCLVSLNVETVKLRSTKIETYIADPTRWREAEQERRHLLTGIKGALCLTIFNEELLSIYILQLEHRDTTEDWIDGLIETDVDDYLLWDNPGIRFNEADVDDYLLWDNPGIRFNETAVDDYLLRDNPGTIFNETAVDDYLLRDNPGTIFNETAVDDYLLRDNPGKFVFTDVCVIAPREVDIMEVHNNLKLVVQHNDQLFFCDMKREEWRPIASLSKEQSLCRQYVFRTNSHVCWL